MISLIIPHHHGVDGADDLLEKCVKSFTGYDELIVFSNNGIGYGAAVNKALKIAHGDYFVISNNDITLISGSLKDLVDQHKITVPTIFPKPRDYKPRSIFGISLHFYKEIIRNYGYFYDERFKMGYFEDDDFIKRIDDLGIKTEVSEEVLVHHMNGGGYTMKQVGEQEYFDLNKKIFQQKWGGNGG